LRSTLIADIVADLLVWVIFEEDIIKAGRCEKPSTAFTIAKYIGPHAYLPKG
jgi:hypothetical protein